MKIYIFLLLFFFSFINLISMEIEWDKVYDFTDSVNYTSNLIMKDYTDDKYIIVYQNTNGYPKKSIQSIYLLLIDKNGNLLKFIDTEYSGWVSDVIVNNKGDINIAASDLYTIKNIKISNNFESISRFQSDSSFRFVFPIFMNFDTIIFPNSFTEGENPSISFYNSNCELIEIKEIKDFNFTLPQNTNASGRISKLDNEYMLQYSIIGKSSSALANSNTLITLLSNTFEFIKNKYFEFEEAPTLYNTSLFSYDIKSNRICILYKELSLKVFKPEFYEIYDFNLDLISRSDTSSINYNKILLKSDFLLAALNIKINDTYSFSFMKLDNNRKIIDSLQIKYIYDTFYDTFIDFYPIENGSCLIFFNHTNRSPLLDKKLYPFGKSAIRVAKIDYSTSSVNEPTISTNLFNIYPNPSSSYIDIDFKDINESEDIIIYNTFGQTLITQKTETNTQRINIEQLPSGVYFIKIGDKVEKFVKI